METKFGRFATHVMLGALGVYVGIFERDLSVPAVLCAPLIAVGILSILFGFCQLVPSKSEDLHVKP